MMGVNRVILVGNTGRDPETRAMPNGGIVSNFSLATNRRWKDPEGTQHEATEWHRVVAFGRLGEVVRDYLRKGNPVFVEGRLKTDAWEDKEGKKHSRTDVIADTVQFLGGHANAANDASVVRRDGAQGADGPPPAAAPPRLRARGNEDIPF